MQWPTVSRTSLSLSFFFSFFYSPSNLAWPRTRIWKRAPGFNWYKTTCNSTNHMEINFGTKVLMKTPSQLVATGGNKHRFVDVPNVETDGIYNLSRDEKHQRVNKGGRLSDSLKVCSFLTRELRACARASCRYAWGMAFACSLDWSIPLNFFSILGFWVHLIVFCEQ